MSKNGILFLFGLGLLLGLCVACDEEPPLDEAADTDADTDTDSDTDTDTDTDTDSDPDAGPSEQLPGIFADGGCDDLLTPGNECDDSTSCGKNIPDCPYDTHVCCVSNYAANAVKCQEGDTCKQGSLASCDGPEDCEDGGTCCLVVNMMAFSAKMSCKPNGCGAGVLEFEMCHRDADCNKPDAKCIKEAPFTWWGFCR